MKITFNKKFRIFPKGYVAEFDSNNIVLVGDNGSGKSTLMLILLSKLFLENNFRSLFLDNKLGSFLNAIEDGEIDVQLDETPIPIIMDEEDFNNAARVSNQMGGIASLARFFDGTRQSSGEKKFEEVVDNIYIYKNGGFEDKQSEYGTILMLDEPDANLSLASLIKLKNELEGVNKSFIILHNPYLINKMEEVYYLSLNKKGKACKLQKISGKEYIEKQEALLTKEIK